MFLLPGSGNGAAFDQRMRARGGFCAMTRSPTAIAITHAAASTAKTRLMTNDMKGSKDDGLGSEVDASGRLRQCQMKVRVTSLLFGLPTIFWIEYGF